MRIIEINALSNGAHRNQNGGFSVVPDGWAVIPDGMEVPETFPFVNITVEGQIVTSIAAGVVPDPEPIVDEPSEADDTAAMLVDHEYRLTMIELGLVE